MGLGWIWRKGLGGVSTVEYDWINQFLRPFKQSEFGIVVHFDLRFVCRMNQVFFRLLCRMIIMIRSQSSANFFFRTRNRFWDSLASLFAAVLFQIP
jgi:hypothetical protein